MATHLARAGANCRTRCGVFRHAATRRGCHCLARLGFWSAAGDNDGGGVDIVVADTGSGLDATLLAELFKPFVTRKKDGTGLGLWISRSLVERYGGDIRAENRGDGVAGAVFTVHLRCEAAAPDKP